MIKPAEIVVPSEDPFKNDALSRKETIEKLTNFLEHLSEPFVLGLNSPWGSGKTTFVRLWNQHLKNAGFNTLYFNAWETDFAEDPFLALAEELRVAIAELENCERSPVRGLSKKIMEASIAIAKKGIPIAVRVATSGLLNIDEKAEEELSALALEIAKERVDEYSRRKNSIGEFKKTLEDLVCALSKVEGPEKPLVIFIDELDRCRPPYAITLLEHAKHIFSVPGIVFVISVDRDQLANSIRSVYGENFDADGYLRRFFDLDFVLPDPPGNDFVQYLYKTMGLFDLVEGRKNGDDPSTLYDTLNLLLPHLHLSLRHQIHILSRLKIVLMTTPGNHWLYPYQLGVLTVLREWKPTLYNSFVEGMTDPKEVIRALEDATGGLIFGDSSGWILEGFIFAMGAEVGKVSPLIQVYLDNIEETRATAPAEAGTDSREKKAIAVYRHNLADHPFDGRGPGLQVTAGRIAFSERLLQKRPLGN
ncbi:MAG: KAP family NTPase [Thermoanaerobaculales bacterium]|nr:KAP family NTPase [Thermoanaerobaculales bacterium]